MFRKLFLIPLMALASLSACLADVSFPSPHGYVNDFANVLDADSRTRLNDVITGLEKKTTAEIAVVTVNSLEGMTVEEYANRLFQKWGIGKKGKDNGLLVLICPQERKMRVEVGYGLEGVITDGLAGSVIRNSFTPAFKQGDYGKGTVEGVTQLARFVAGADSVQTWRAAHPELVSRGQFAARLFKTLFFSLFVVFGLIAVGMGISDKVVFLIVWGLFFGGIPLSSIIMEEGLESWNADALMVMGLLALIAGLWLGFRYPKALKTARKGNAKGWIWGATSGGSGGSWGGGGGGFGGGSSGGGGASGSW